MNKTVSYSIIYASITLFPLVLTYLIKKRYKDICEKLESKSDIETTTSYYQTVFFDYNNFKCKPHLINKEEYGENCSVRHLKSLVRFISSAQNSISLCCYTITLKDISFELINAHKRGVRVRIITDKVMTKTSGSKVDFCQKYGIARKTQSKEDNMMHHKFCLIDEKDEEKGKMFFGSLNLTVQAFSQNFDTIILTNDLKIVKRFSEEFEDLWDTFK